MYNTIVRSDRGSTRDAQCGRTYARQKCDPILWTLVRLLHLCVLLLLNTLQHRLESDAAHVAHRSASALAAALNEGNVL
jgi:hypothetical protein